MSTPAPQPLLAILIASILGISLPAAEYYVDDSSTAKDVNPGSSTSPWRTIQKAADTVREGDTVHVAPGVYNAAVTVRTSGSAAKRIRFLSDTRGGATINVTGVASVWQISGSYIDVVGFDISSTDSSINGARLGINVEASNCRIIGNIIHDIPAAAGTGGSGGAGIGIGTYPTVTSGNECVGNFVHHIGPRTANNKIHGIYVRDRYCLVANNITFANAGSGITSWHYATNMTVVNNLVFGNTYGGIVVGGDVLTNAGTLLANNIVINNSNAPAISEFGKTGTDNRYLNNCVYGNTYSGQPTTFSLKNGLVALNTVTADARFVNFKADGSGDYHLFADSSCIDTGTTTGALPTDFDGRARGATYDIGPYEYAGDITAPTVPGGLTATVNSASRITLAWAASTDNLAVAGYRIYRGGTQIATTTGTTYVNTGLTASTAYTYAVAAYDTASPANVSARSATVTATTQANHAPVATAQSASTAEDTAKVITLAGTDADSHALTYVIVANPTHGTLSGSGASRTYTPDANYTGADSFTFKVNDGALDSPAATVALTVTAVNDTPVATAQSVTTAQSIAKAITLTGTDVEGSTLTFAIATNPVHGTLSGSGPSRTYTPTTGYTGGDSFTFTVNDGSVTSGAATVTIAVTAVANTAPVVSAASATPSPVTGKTANVSATATDNGGEPALLYTWSATGPATVTFSPNASNAAKASVATFNKAGSYTLTVTAKDAAGLTGTKTVALSVSATPTRLSISPTGASVQPLKAVDFSAIAEDQFGIALGAQPTMAWTVSGGGTIDASGMFTAGSGTPSPSGGIVATTYVVTATAGGQNATALVTVSTASTATPGGSGSGACGSGAAGLLIGPAMVLGLRRRR